MAYLIFFSWLITLVIVMEIVTTIVYGWLISEADLKVFLTNHIHDYEVSSVSHYSMLHPLYNKNEKIPFIAKSQNSLLSSWYINDYGRIPRWSPYHRFLNEVHAILKEEAIKLDGPKKSLADI